jgi:hypothetical protein
MLSMHERKRMNRPSCDYGTVLQDCDISEAWDLRHKNTNISKKMISTLAVSKALEHVLKKVDRRFRYLDIGYIRQPK